MVNWREHISIDPEVMVGKPCIAGTRVPVEHILEKIAADIPIEDILYDYPRVTREHVLAAVAYAVATMRGEEIIVTEPIT
jgi:uncharacterized protein (DUF433 family)